MKFRPPNAQKKRHVSLTTKCSKLWLRRVAFCYCQQIFGSSLAIDTNLDGGVLEQWDGKNGEENAIKVQRWIWRHSD
jgi:hypothetical protein